MRAHFYNFQAGVGNAIENHKTLKDVQLLRAFRWTLSDEDANLADSWISQVLKQHIGPARSTKQLTHDGDVGVQSASTSSTALACPLALLCNGFVHWVVDRPRRQRRKPEKKRRNRATHDTR